jgi:hypothetical protein
MYQGKVSEAMANVKAQMPNQIQSPNEMPKSLDSGASSRSSILDFPFWNLTFI